MQVNSNAYSHNTIAQSLKNSDKNFIAMNMQKQEQDIQKEIDKMNKAAQNTSGVSDKIDNMASYTNYIFTDTTKTQIPKDEVENFSLTASLYLGNMIGNSSMPEISAFKIGDFLQAKSESEFKKGLGDFEGYELDSYGFLSEQFLIDNNLPVDLKIHSNTLQAIKNAHITPHTFPSQNGNLFGANFEKIDLGGGLKNAYADLIQILPLKESYTLEEVQIAAKNSDLDSMLSFSFAIKNSEIAKDYTFYDENGNKKIALEGVLLALAASDQKFFENAPNSVLGNASKYQNIKADDIEQIKEIKVDTDEEIKAKLIDWLLNSFVGNIDNQKS